MTALADTAIEITDDRLAARNALVLAVAQALAGGNNTVVVATGGIAGSMLAPDPMLATLPISVMVVGMWLGTLPVGMLAKAFGRRFALQVGSALGVLSGLVSCLAMLSGSFLLLLFGTLCAGLYAAAHQSYRFAAADTASVQFRAKAISWVLAGGIFAAVIGPQLVIFTKDVWPAYLFAGTYLAQAACAVLAAVVLTFLRIPRPPTVRTFADGRPLAEIIRKPQFIVAVGCGLASFGTMNLLMTSAPLAMVMCNHSVGEAALGIQWHVLGMYAPSFFTGALIARLGLRTIMASGLSLISGRCFGRVRRDRLVEFLGGADAARRWLELCLHQCDDAHYRMPWPARAQQGAGVQRLSDIRRNGSCLVLIRSAAYALWLDGGHRSGLSGGHCRRRAAGLGHVRAPAQSGVRRTFPRNSRRHGNLIRGRCSKSFRTRKARVTGIKLPKTACHMDFQQSA